MRNNLIQKSLDKTVKLESSSFIERMETVFQGCIVEYTPGLHPARPAPFFDHVKENSLAQCRLFSHRPQSNEENRNVSSFQLN